MGQCLLSDDTTVFGVILITPGGMQVTSLHLCKLIIIQILMLKPLIIYYTQVEWTLEFTHLTPSIECYIEHLSVLSTLCYGYRG